MDEPENIRINQFREKEPVFTRKNIGKSFHSVVDGSFLSREKVMRMVPFLLFLLLLAVFYITNIFYAEKTIREIDDAKQELKELQYEFITAKSDLMTKSKRSEIAKDLENEGIKESSIPPRKLYINRADTLETKTENNRSGQ